MTVETLSSTNITNLDATPMIFQTAGEGSPGQDAIQSDNVAHTSAFGSAAKNTSRQARFPTQAKVKHVYIYTKGLDSNVAATLTLDLNVAFSDSKTDGTPPGARDGTTGEGLIPQSALTGAVTNLSSYTSANKMFGSAYAVANSGAVKYTEVTFNNTYTPALALQPMWAVMGGTGAASAAPFAAGGGFAQQSNGQIDNPGGFFDMLAVVSGTAATAATGSIGMEVDYVR